MSVRKQTEAEFLRLVIQYARLMGWQAYHTHDSRRSDEGFPDLVMLRGDTIVIAELKVGKNPTSPAQDKWLAAWAAAKVPAYVWRPDDWNDIHRVFGPEGQ